MKDPKRVAAAIIHGGRYLPEYSSWSSMKDRCLNKRSKDFHKYGGRGITICQSWIDSFSSFYKDMGPKPSPQHTIERLNNDVSYSPDNCKWGTKYEQTHNRRAFTRRYGPSKKYKLSPSDVVEIRTLRASGATRKEIMKQYNICYTTVFDIDNELRWANWAPALKVAA